MRFRADVKSVSEIRLVRPQFGILKLASHGCLGGRQRVSGPYRDHACKVSARHGALASDMTDAEWSFIAPMMPVNRIGRPRETDLAGGGERDLVYGGDRLPMAAVAERVSAVFDRGAGVFLPLAGRRSTADQVLVVRRRQRHEPRLLPR